MSVVIETTIGDLTVDLFVQERPVACLNFMKLCKLKYYNYNLFHTIEQGFIAQTGDPTGAGDGGSSIWGVVEGQHKRFFEAESLPKIHHTTVGLLSLVGAGKHLVGSQFFFTLGEKLTSLDGQHCIIGEVVEGHEVLRQLNEAIVDENFRPYQDIRITHTVILEDPFPDPRGFREPSRSPSPNADRLKNGRIAADEDIDDTEGKSNEEIQEMLAEREAKARATILEIVGDLPDAEVAPPENVLFVCKLNPVTNDDDLEIIFSRFGKVKGCEVIRDRKTGDSLQYAFVEFEEQKSCEAAYFKMDNVLIDDRRIHVDFSQSVSKVKWKGKGRGVEGDSKCLDFNNLSDKKHEGQNRSSWQNYNKEKRFSATSEKRYESSRRRQSRSHSIESRRMSSAERRIHREKHHRDQDKQRKSGTRPYHMCREERDREQHRGRSRSGSRSYHVSPERESSSYDRKLNKKRDEKYSPKRQYNHRSRDEIQSDNNDAQRRRARHSPQRQYRGYNSNETKRKQRETPERRKLNIFPECGSRKETKATKKRKEPDHNKKTKKSRCESSSSEDSESDTSSESSQTSTSDSDSSSEMEKRKRLKKSKHKKNKFKKRKSNKHSK